ncbi:hypothetical protein ACHAW6_002244 [Cyclotella cf. meneghiniana]
MTHPTEWWLQNPCGDDDQPSTYQAINELYHENGATDDEGQGSEESHSNNPLHDFLNSTILSYQSRCTPSSPDSNKQEDDSTNRSQSDPQSPTAGQSSLGSNSSTLTPPHKTLLVLFFDVIRFIAVNADCRLINTELMPIFWSGIGKTIKDQMHRGRPSGTGEEKMEVLHVAIRIFMSVFALLLLLIEFPDTFPILQMAPSTSNNSSFRNSPPPLTLYNWIPRGIFYIFLSVVCFQQEIVVRALDMDEHLSTSSRFFDSIPIVLAAWFMLGTGIMYVLLGMCCLQKVMERVRREEKECWDEYYEHLRLLDLEESEVEEREWMLENEEGDRSGCCYCGCCRIWGEPCRRWYRRYRRRRQRGEGFCSVLGCRSLDWRC